MKIILEDKENMNLIGDRVKAARANLKLSQKQLSKMLELINIHLDRSSIAKIEQNMRIVKDFELLGLSIVLKVSIQFLIES